MNHILNICLPCGMCCDGTLIGHVQLEKEEIPTLKEIMEIEVEEEKGFFLQPCNKYCKGCSIYDQRPKKCSEFNCDLLKSVEQNELTFDAAVEIINLAKEKKVLILQLIKQMEIILKSESFHFKMVELKLVLGKINQETSFSQELNTELELLDQLLLQRFGLSML